MGYNCQRRPVPDSCAASLICSPGDLHSSQFRFGCSVTHEPCFPPSQSGWRRRRKAMLIEGTSSSPRIPLSVCLKSRHNNEKITRALTGRKIWLRSAVQNKDENRAGRRGGWRQRKGEGGGFTEEMRYGRKGRGEERGGAWLQREREREENQIFVSFPRP